MLRGEPAVVVVQSHDVFLVEFTERHLDDDPSALRLEPVQRPCRYGKNLPFDEGHSDAFPVGLDGRSRVALGQYPKFGTMIVVLETKTFACRNVHGLKVPLFPRIPTKEFAPRTHRLRCRATGCRYHPRGRLHLAALPDIKRHGDAEFLAHR